MQTAVEISKKIFNEVYLAYLKAQEYIQFFFGGSSSGKSKFLASRAVIDVLSENRNYLCIRKYKIDLRDSCFAEIVKFINEHNLQDLFNIRESNLRITCINNNEILFSGLDDVEKLKSVTPKKGVITDVWIEEATQIKEDDFKQISKRLRGGDPNIKKRITFSFNPIIQSHWIKKKFFEDFKNTDRELRREDKLIVKTTYEDNRFLTKQDIELLENEDDKYYHDVYTLGNWGILGNTIFTNYEIRDLSDLKRSWNKNIYGGVDFGFTHPAAGLSLGYDKEKKEIYIFDECGGSGLTNEMLADQLKKLIASNFYCDPAEPKSIQELKNCGIVAYPADKGHGSIIYGIKWLQKVKIIIDISCVRLAEEIQNYKWLEKRNGEVVEQPVDKDNHWIDALRYGIEPIHGYELAGNGRINVAII